MTAPLLTTKLYIPPPCPNLVPRPRLLQQLDDGLRQARVLTLVSAPAGFGKTTLVSEWVCSSARELEVLRLIAAGLSNREIAGELFIAVGTVKRHINHVYGKLAVRSRTQAIAKARELRLLE